MAKEIIHGLNSYLTFQIANQLFGVNIGHVSKILELADITQIPNSPKYLKGIINLFGNILPVFDGRMKFGLPDKVVARATCILVLVYEFEGLPSSSGIIVDSVEKVIQLAEEQIKEIQNSDENFNYTYVQGIARFSDDAVVILNVEKLFSADELTLIKIEE